MDTPEQAPPPRFIREAARVGESLKPPTETTAFDEAVLRTHRDRHQRELALRPAVKRLHKAVCVAGGLLLLYWIAGLVDRYEVRRADSFKLGVLRGYAKSDPALQRAIDKADDEYHYYLVSLRDDAE